MRLIDAEELWDDLMRLGFTYFARADISRAIKEAPTIEVDPVKHGKWIMLKDSNGFHREVCSVCYDGCPECSGKSNYCPNCGVRMDGDQE